MIRMFFGVPGCGKTTMAVRQSIKDKTHDYVYTNFSCSHPLVCDGFTPLDLGNWTVPKNSLISIDEASCEWNNRSFKSFPRELIEYLKKHRHYKVDIDLYSQSWDDVDITARRLVEELWYGRKLFLGITVWRRIYKFIDVEKTSDSATTGQIIDGYKKAKVLKFWDPHNWKFIYRWNWYGFFDSWESFNLKIKDFSAVNRQPKRRVFKKIIGDWYVQILKKRELLKAKIYCLNRGIVLTEKK